MYRTVWLCVLLAVTTSGEPTENFDFPLCKDGFHTNFQSIVPIDLDSGDEHLWGMESYSTNKIGIYYGGTIEGTLYGVHRLRDGTQFQAFTLLEDHGRVQGSAIISSEIGHKRSQWYVKDELVFLSRTRGPITLTITWDIPKNCNERQCQEPVKLREVTDVKVILEDSVEAGLSFPNAIALVPRGDTLGAFISNSFKQSDLSMGLNFLVEGSGSLFYMRDVRDPNTLDLVLSGLGFANGIICKPNLTCYIAETSVPGRLRKLLFSYDNDTKAVKLESEKSIYMGPMMPDNLHWMNVHDTDEPDYTHLVVGYSRLSPRIAKLTSQILPLPAWIPESVLTGADKIFELSSRVFQILLKSGEVGIWNIEDECMEGVLEASNDEQRARMKTLAGAKLLSADPERSNVTRFEFLLEHYGPTATAIGTVEIDDLEESTEEGRGGEL